MKQQFLRDIRTQCRNRWWPGFYLLDLRRETVVARMCSFLLTSRVLVFWISRDPPQDKIATHETFPKQHSTINHAYCRFQLRACDWKEKILRLWNSVAYAENFHEGVSFSGIWWSFLFNVCCSWRHNLTSYSCFQTNVSTKFLETLYNVLYILLHALSCFMCHCTEYKLSALQVRISEENTLVGAACLHLFNVLL